MTDLFKEKAQAWDANDRVRLLSNAIGDCIVDQVTIHAQMDVLDFGAGTGLISAQLAPRVNSILALDTSEAMLEKLLAKEALKDKVKALCQDILHEPLDTQFHLIVSAMALHHVENTALLLQRFAQHLVPGGAIALADLDKEDGTFHPPGTEGVFHQGFDRDALQALLNTSGFINVRFATAHIIQGKERDFPIFLVSAVKS
ncbi:MAG: class I SAM-dependent methyltransferase [Gammaproteobacteria bacterium]|nr:class I SAM-dependent methyltransferase [Gammaproteobacteria bacterium]